MLFKQVEKPKQKVEKQTNGKNSRTSTQKKKKILYAVRYGKYMAFNLNKTIKHTQEADGFVKPGGQTHQVLTRPQI